MNGKVLIGVVAVVAVVAVAAAAIALGGDDKDDNVTITEGVLYYPNGGTGEKDHYEFSSTTVIDGSRWFSYPDKVFINWNTKADGTGIVYLPGDSIDYGHKTVKLYAQWGEKTVYNVTSFTKNDPGIGMKIELNGKTPSMLGMDPVYKTVGNVIEITTSDRCSGFVWSEEDQCFKFTMTNTDGKKYDMTLTVKMTNATGVLHQVNDNMMLIGFKATGNMEIDIAAHIMR